jgi:hypothetical protein
MGLFRRKNRGEPAPSEGASLPDAASEAAEPAASGESDGEKASVLVDRLRHMDWPSPPEEVRERCLEQIMQRVAVKPEKPAPGTATGEVEPA